MKKIVLMCAALFVSSALFALPFSFGANFGTNMESTDGYAFQAGVHADYAVLKMLRTGVQFDVSMAKNSMAYDPTVYAKLYLPFGFKHLVPFVRGDAGYTVLITEKQEEPYKMFSGGVSAGVRMEFSGFYLEPRASFGYPYLWGADLAVGYSFKK